MRIRVHLRSPPPIAVPLNHTYHLAALIYRLLERSSSEYAAFLHGQGYGDGDRRFKLFTFSPLLGRSRRTLADMIQFGAGGISWYITSPVEAFVLHLVQGLLSVGQVELADVTFAIEQVETLPEPRVTGEMRFTCFSPITMSVRSSGQRWAQYLSPEDPRFATAIRTNLERKYALVQTLAGGVPAPPRLEPFSLTFDPAYVARHEGRISKLIDYKGTKIRGYLAPVTVTGAPELLGTGYQCGFGDKNSQGFGMVEVARRQSPEST